MNRWLLIVILMLSLAACNDDSHTDGRRNVVMWDSSCKAYSIHFHMGDAYFVDRMPDMDGKCPKADAK